MTESRTETPPDAIRTRRLSLEVLEPAVIRLLLGSDVAAAEAALGAGLPAGFSGERVHWLSRHLSLIERHPGRRAWCARLIRLAEGGEIAGNCGFHGPPERVGRAEIGYTVFEPFRGRGLAKEAARGLVEWAFAEGVEEVFAAVSPGNAPSLAVVRAIGFRRVGEQVDPVDGHELVFTVTPATLAPPAG